MYTVHVLCSYIRAAHICLFCIAYRVYILPLNIRISQKCATTAGIGSTAPASVGVSLLCFKPIVLMAILL